MLGPLDASSMGMWGILRPPPAVISSPLGRGLSGLSRKAVSASQGSAFHWHRGSPVTQCRLAEDFAAVAQMSEVESLLDASLGNLSGAPRLDEGVAPSIVESELVPGTMVLWSPANSEDVGTRLAIVTALAFRERESSANSPWWDFLSIYDGKKE